MLLASHGGWGVGVSAGVTKSHCVGVSLLKAQWENMRGKTDCRDSDGVVDYGDMYFT
jgi:hypothetical protein